MGIVFLVLLIPVFAALVFGWKDAAKCIAEATSKPKTVGILVFVAMTFGLLTAVTPYWSRANGECYPPSIWEEILTFAMPAWFIVSWLAKKFADEYAIQNLQLFSIGVKLAIPVSFILYICLNDFLFGFFRLTLVY